MHRDEVGLAHQLLEIHELHAHVPGPVRRDKGVVGDQAHAEGHRPLSHQGPYPAEADDTEGLAVELDSFPLGPLPLSRHQRRVGLGDVAGLGQQQGHGLLGRRQDVRLGCVDDHHATFGGGGHVDVVEADAGPPDDDQVAPGGKDLGGHGGGRPDDQGVRPDDGFDQLFGSQSELDVHLVAGLGHEVQTRLGQLFGDEDPTHDVPFDWKSAWRSVGRR